MAGHGAASDDAADVLTETLLHVAQSQKMRKVQALQEEIHRISHVDGLELIRQGLEFDAADVHFPRARRAACRLVLNSPEHEVTRVSFKPAGATHFTVSLWLLDATKRLRVNERQVRDVELAAAWSRAF